MKSLKTKDIVYLWIIVLLFLGLTFILSNTMYLYGSQLDWYSEHITIPDYFRTLFYSTKDLFPDFAANIGSGQNIYNFSYYGLLSPIIVISYLFPHVKMTTYIMASTIITVIVSVILLYIFLKKKKYSSETCLLSCLMFSFAACISLHSHRHIMFMTYMPFLILGLFGVDKKLDDNKGWLLSLSVFLMIMTNYYFSIGGIFALVIYGIYKYLKSINKFNIKMFFKKGINFILPIFIGVLSASIIILPTLAALLNNRADSNVSISIWDLIIPKVNAEYILYDAYGVGLTAIAFPALINFFNKKKENIFLAIILSLFIIFPIFNYILNGTMYIDSKSLIPFIVLYVIVIAEFIQNIIDQKLNFKILVPISIVVGLLAGLNDHRMFVIFLDLLIISIGIALYYKFNKKVLLIIPLVTVTLIASYAINSQDELVLKFTAKQNENEIKDKINYITNEDKSFYRISNDTDVSENTNRIYQNIDYYNSTIYSSISNQKYNSFYFDTINNNISSRNRALTITTGNIFSLLLTDNEYVISRNKPLQGYELVKVDEGINIYKNENVLPLGFASSNIMSYDDFNKLNFATQMEALLNVLVVDDTSSNSFIPATKKVEYESSQIDEILKHDNISKDGNNYVINTEEPIKLEYELPEKYQNKILIIRFKMNYNQTCGEGDQVIRINNIKNKLTCSSWKYHNGNEYFDFVLAEQDLTKLTITIQEGKYNIGDLEIYSLDYANIEKINSSIDPLIINKDKTKGDIINGKVDVKEDGYMMLTIPYDKGFNIKVDDKIVDYELIDNAFIGFKISAGEHDINIEYKSPLKNISLILSIVGLISLVFVSVIESKRTI